MGLFVSTIRFATTSLIANTNLVTKIYLPRRSFRSRDAVAVDDFAVAALVLVPVLASYTSVSSVQLLWATISHPRTGFVDSGWASHSPPPACSFATSSTWVEWSSLLRSFLHRCLRSSMFGHWASV